MASVNSKKIVLRDEARVELLEGVNRLAEVVGATLGPGGRNVLLDQGAFQYPRSSRDGVTVAKHVALSNPIANLAAQLVRQAAEKAATTAGDGTTTTVIITQAIFREGVRLIAAGANPVALRRGIEQAAAAIVGTKDELTGKYQGGALAAITQPVDPADQATIVKVGTLSANSDPALGAIIAEAVRQVGKDGTVTVEESQGMETTLDVVEGMQFNQGYLSPYFITDGERGEVVLQGDAQRPLYVYLHEKRLTHYKDLLPWLQSIVGPKGGSLLVVAEDITDSALGLLVQSRLQNGFRCCAVKGPGFGDRRRALFDDLAVLTGATLIAAELGIKAEGVTEGMLGRATRITITKDDCTVVGGEGDRDLVEGRINDLRAQIRLAESDFDRTRLEERLAKLTGGVAVVKVGGQTESEMKERKDRAEDAMYATRAAVAEGVVPGGGMALIRCVDSEEFQAGMRAAAAEGGDVALGWRLVAKAAEEPLRRIVANAGGEGGEVVAELRRRVSSSALIFPASAVSQEDLDKLELVNGGKIEYRHETPPLSWTCSIAINLGYNAATGEFCDLIAAGVIDPARVTRTALLAACSVASVLLTNEAVVADDIEEMGKARRALAPVMPQQPGMPMQY